MRRYNKKWLQEWEYNIYTQFGKAFQKWSRDQDQLPDHNGHGCYGRPTG